MKKKYVVLLHLLFWFYFVINYFLRVDFETGTLIFPDFSVDIHQPEIGLTYTFFFIYILVFYLNYWIIMPKFFDIKNIQKVLLALFGLFILFTGLRFLIEEILILKLLGYHNYAQGVSGNFYIWDNMYYGSLPIIASSVLWFVVNTLHLQKKQIELIESKREAEINFLKSQINPHFIFNTLNNIYYLVFEKSNKSLKAIEQLSGLMRYMTYESLNDTLPIQQEIKYIEDFIQLETMRISGRSNILFNTEIENIEFRIPPLLLIPFIENGFKHGIVNDEANPFVIKISQKNKVLTLETSNLINKYAKDSHTGIGIDNIKKRLQLHFPNNHTLKITITENIYHAKLVITL
ncbi:sensor histidine kinase [Myroides indicus]|uniref:Histidine kinase n=1 Tax=Myroides indicus TaxID=1323422 RepID=A0A4R7FB56_9FLAO|nr:histidine kinase [Myroides indicus]TDS64362.1 histidine kinase [Myroides indicus]